MSGLILLPDEQAPAAPAEAVQTPAAPKGLILLPGAETPAVAAPPQPQQPLARGRSLPTAGFKASPEATTGRAAMDLLTGADNVVRSVARGVPVIGGAMDEIAAKADELTGRGGTYDQNLEYQRTRDAQYDAKHPIASTAGQMAGTVAGTMAGANALRMTGAANLVPSMPTTMVGKVAGGAGTGAALGTVEGFTRGEGAKDRMENAVNTGAWGAAFGAGIPIISNLVGSAFRKWVVKDQPIPLKEQLFEEGSTLYNLSRNRDFALNKDATNFLINSLDDKMTKMGFLEDAPAHSNARAVFKRIASYRDSTMTPVELDSIFKQIRNIANNSAKRADGGDEARILYGMFDDLMENFDMLDPEGSVTSLSTAAPQEFKAIWNEARKKWATAMSLEKLEGVKDKALFGAQNRTYGQNLSTQMKIIARNPKQLEKFPKAVRPMIRDMAEGDGVEQSLRFLGNKLGSLPGMATSYGVGDVTGLAAGWAGKEVLTRLADAILKSKLNALEKQILSTGVNRYGSAISKPAQQLMEIIMPRIGEVQMADPAKRRGLELTVRPGSYVP